MKKSPVPSSPEHSASDSDPPTFEQALESLERIVEKLEGGQLSLEESMHFFEQGMGHAKRCEELLNQVEGKIQQLVEMKDGALVATNSEGTEDE